MENKKEIDLFDLAQQVWKARKKIIKWSVVGLIFGLIISISIPKEYTSIIKFAPESQNKSLSGSAGALASIAGIGTSINYEGINEKVYPEIISSTPFLLEFAKIEVEFEKKAMPLHQYILKNSKVAWWNYILGAPSRLIGWVMSIGKERVDTMTIDNSPAIQYAFASSMNDGINIELDSKLGIIKLESTFQDPKITKTISDSLIVKLERYMSGYRTAKTRDNLKSTQNMLHDAKERYYLADELYAKAMDRNQNLITKSAAISLERLANERNLTSQVYLQLAQQLETTRIKLQEETPVATIIEPATTPILPSAPSKMLIIIAWTFLAGFVSVLTVIVKELLGK